jgi:hypothetical protein
VKKFEMNVPAMPGPLIYVRLLGRDVIIINSEEVLQELIEKRSSIYNDRPRYVTNELCVAFGSTVTVDEY